MRVTKEKVLEDLGYKSIGAAFSAATGIPGIVVGLVGEAMFVSNALDKLAEIDFKDEAKKPAIRNVDFNKRIPATVDKIFPK